MLKHFFDISTGFRYKKKMEESSPSIYRDVHVLVTRQTHSETDMYQECQKRPDRQYRGLSSIFQIRKIENKQGVSFIYFLHIFLPSLHKFPPPY